MLAPAWVTVTEIVTTVAFKATTGADGNSRRTRPFQGESS